MKRRTTGDWVYDCNSINSRSLCTAGASGKEKEDRDRQGRPDEHTAVSVHSAAAGSCVKEAASKAGGSGKARELDDPKKSVREKTGEDMNGYGYKEGGIIISDSIIDVTPKSWTV